jgi:hypothetical protein
MYGVASFPLKMLKAAIAEGGVARVRALFDVCF